MASKSVRVILLFVLFANLSTGENLKRLESLHSRYQVEWEVNLQSETVEFTVTAQTTGFVGFGLSYNGAMNGADIVVGGVDATGSKYFHDYHGTGNEPPVLDTKQNWDLLDASENGNVTTLKFKRVWDTCDDEDVTIDKGTVQMIWSLGETDELQYHNEFKGGLAVNLLDPPLAPVNLTEVSHEITKTYTLDGRDTAYWCSVHKRIPQNKTHIIAFKPKLETEAALKYTHHFNIYICKAPEEVFDKFIDLDPVDCFDMNSELSKARGYCTLSLYAWSFGGRLLTLPENIGFPWGEETVEYYYLETHVDNPRKLHNISFETGVQFYDTTDLRPIEAGMLALAYGTSMSLFIPPNATNWTIAGHASSYCTDLSLPPTGISIFNINLHAHISGKEMVFRQFRNGIELPWIAKDSHYDFNYQENRPLMEDAVVLPGDHLTLECVFDSTWQSPSYPVIGGYPSTDEMCMVFAFYHPRISTGGFLSYYSETDLVARYGITNITDRMVTYPSLDPFVIEPLKWKGQKVTEVLNSTVNWTAEEIASLQKELRFGNHIERCDAEDETGQKNIITSQIFLPFMKQMYKQDAPRTVTYPEIKKVYEEIRNCPVGKNSGTIIGKGEISIFIGIVGLMFFL